MAKQDWKASGGQGRQVKDRWAPEPRERWRTFSRLSLPLFVFLIALSTLLIVLQWLSPPVSPTLFVLSTPAQNAASTPNLLTILPPNDPAGRDAESLRSLRTLFEVASTDVQPLDPTQLRKVLSEIAQSDPKPPLLAPWKPTELIVYVNMVGVRRDSGTGQPRAWLVAEGFDPDQKLGGQLVSVHDLLENVARSKATRKLVVLDCQRSAVNPHFGLATEQFVNAVQEDLEDLSSEAREIPVLFSCGADEVAWPTPDGAGTAFGHFFMRGILGDADAREGSGNGDRRVTLDELEKYLKSNVGDWTAIHCDASQAPFLANPTGTTEFTLAVLGERSTSVTGAAPSRAAVQSDLKSRFEKVYIMARRPAPPEEWTPALWAMTYHDLAAAERFYRSGNVAAAGTALGRVDQHLKRVSQTHKDLRDGIDELSPTTARFLNRCCADGWPELPRLAPSSADDAVSDVVNGTRTPDEADKQLGEIVSGTSEILPVAAHWNRLAAARSRAGNLRLDAGQLRGLIALRQRAETAARPGHPLASGWMQRSLDTADVARRAAEDRLLLKDWSPLAMGSPVVATSNASAKYDDAADIQETISKAYRFRDRLLTELPYWIAYVGRSASHAYADAAQNAATEPGKDAAEPQKTSAEPEESAAEPQKSAAQPENREPEGEELAAQPEGMDFPATASRGVDALLKELRDLTQTLLADPRHLTDDEISRKLAEIKKSSLAIELLLSRLEEELPKYADSLSQVRLAPEGGGTWRRIDDLLVLPFAMVEKTRDATADAQQASQLRIKLLERALPVKLEESGQPDLHAQDQADKPPRVAAMYARLYSLPWISSQTTEEGESPATVVDAVPATEEGVVSGDLYSWLVDRAKEGRLRDVDRETVQRADLAFRLLQRGREADVTVDSPAIRLRIDALRDWVTWQAQRMCEDFYAATDHGRPPYFARVSTELLADAERLTKVGGFLSRSAPEPGEPIETEKTTEAKPDSTVPRTNVEQELDKFVAALDSARLTSEPAKLIYRGNAPADLQIGLSDAAKFPSGTAAVAMSDGAPSGSTGGTAGFVIPQPRGGSVQTVVSGYFRGHEFARDVPLTVVEEYAGPTITYGHQNTGKARVRFQATRVEQNPIHLLFVLDCSGSMGLPDSTGESRIDGLRHALTRFVEAVHGSNVHIGVRLFGRRVEDIKSPEARTDTELALPIGQLGRGTLEALRDLLIAKGHSPMYRALIDAKGDFASVGAGRRVLVLISDGADNWARAGEKPGFNELLETYRGAGIEVNTIGFQAENNADFAELRRIASAGDSPGECMPVQDANNLLEQMSGLVGLPGYRILRDGQVVREESQFSSADPDQNELPPGQYDVEILGPAHETLTRRAVRLLPADEHVLKFDAGALRYATSPAQSARAKTEGGPDQPDLLVFDAKSVGNEFVVEFGLEQKLGKTEDLSPVSVRIAAIADAASQREWVFKNIAPNVPGQHIPVWRVSLPDWPARADQIEVKVVWNDLAAKSVPVPLDWGQAFSVKAVTENVNLVLRDRKEVNLDGLSQTAVQLTFVNSDPAANIEEWGISTQLPLVHVRQAYSREYGTYTVELVVPPNTELNEVTLFRAAPAAEGRTLRAQASVSEKRINP